MVRFNHTYNIYDDKSYHVGNINSMGANETSTSDVAPSKRHNYTINNEIKCNPEISDSL